MTSQPEPLHGRFCSEADMLLPLSRAAELFAANSQVLFEVPANSGVPDVVLVELDQEAMRIRGQVTPLLEPVEVRVMVAISSHPVLPHNCSLEALESEVGVSARHLKRVVLPRLLEGGHVDRDEGEWVPRYRFRSLARRLVTIEAKLRDWRGGVAQVSRHAAVADAAWLAIDAGSADTAKNHPEWFTTYGIGLASLSTNGDLRRLIEPRDAINRRTDREVLAERAVAMIREGKSSGPVPKVFGNYLVATTGVDPRLVGAGVH